MREAMLFSVARERGEEDARMAKRVGYEVHWAASNRADQLMALREGARRHEQRQDAEAEAGTLRSGPASSRGDIVPIVVEVQS